MILDFIFNLKYELDTLENFNLLKWIEKFYFLFCIILQTSQMNANSKLHIGNQI